MYAYRTSQNIRTQCMHTGHLKLLVHNACIQDISNYSYTMYVNGTPHLDPSTAALGNSIRHPGSGRVDHCHQPHEPQILQGEIDIVWVKSELSGELSGRKHEVTEAWKWENDNDVNSYMPRDSFYTKYPEAKKPSCFCKRWPPTKNNNRGIYSCNHILFE